MLNWTKLNHEFILLKCNNYFIKKLAEVYFNYYNFHLLANYSPKLKIKNEKKWSNVYSSGTIYQTYGFIEYS
jgi:hypothetical protein